jgi:hypothetical protein
MLGGASLRTASAPLSHRSGARIEASFHFQGNAGISATSCVSISLSLLVLQPTRQLSQVVSSNELVCSFAIKCVVAQAALPPLHAARIESAHPTKRVRSRSCRPAAGPPALRQTQGPGG